MRAILLGGPLCVGTALACSPFEEPPVIQDSETTTDSATAGSSTNPPPTSGPTTNGPATEPPTDDTTVDPTTMGSVDDTTDVTTMEASATDSSSSSSSGDPCVAACSGIACEMVDGCDCGECGPMATCADDQTYCGQPIGYFNVFPDEEPVFGQVQFGFRFTVFEPRTVRRLGVIASGAGSDIRLALYDHDGSGPANRIVQTGAVTLYANGPNEFDVGATPIAPGDYWVMVHTAGLTPFYRTLTDDYEEAYRTMIPFASGFPVLMDDETVATDFRYNLYMVVEE